MRGGAGRGGAEPAGAAHGPAGRRSRGSLNAAPRFREVPLLPADPARATAMSWELLLSLLALGALLAFVVQLLRFLRADGDLTLLWAEWQGRRPGEDPQPPPGSGRPGPLRLSRRSRRISLGGVELPRGKAEPFPGAAGRGGKEVLPFVFSPGLLDLPGAKVRGCWSRRAPLGP